MVKAKGTGGYQIISCDFSDLSSFNDDTSAQILLYETLEKASKNGKQCLLQTNTGVNQVVVPMQVNLSEYTDGDDIVHNIMMITISSIDYVTNPFDIDNVNQLCFRLVIDRYFDEETESYVYLGIPHIYAYTLSELE